MSTDPNSSRSYRGGCNKGGIIFKVDKEGDMQNITLKNLTVKNATFNGVFISGAAKVIVDQCDFTENGSMDQSCSTIY